jgi:dephospho-CoA kinase
VVIATLFGNEIRGIMRVFGLTGGIASGKSTVAARFRERIPVIDADDLAREVTSAKSPALLEIAERFGPEMVNSEGELNRSRLAAVVFNDQAQLKILNGIVHPRVQALLQDRLRDLETKGHTVVCYEVPLLFESGLEAHLKPVVLVAAARETQIARAMRRSGLTREQASARIDAQLPLAEKAARSDFVIHNDGELSDTLAQADRVLDRVLETCGSG